MLTVAFEIDGRAFTALNGGPMFKFSEAVSLVVNCDTQDEVDETWARLLDGGKAQQCGWLKDKYGLSWQVVPVALFAMLRDSDPAKVARVTQEMLTQVKPDLPRLQRAYDGA